MPDIPFNGPPVIMQYPNDLVVAGKTYTIVKFRAWEVKPATVDSLNSGPQLKAQYQSTIDSIGKLFTGGPIDFSSLGTVVSGLTGIGQELTNVIFDQNNLSNLFVNDPNQSKSTRTKIRAPRQEAKETVFLYLPPDLATSYAIEYEEQDFTGADFLYDIIRNSVKNNDGTLDPEVYERILHTVGPQFIDKITSIVPGLGLNLTGTIAQLRGKIPTPRLEYQFKNVGKRSFQFEFKMFPLDENENKMVHDIIKTFKKYSLPVYDGQFYKFPAEFDISFHSVVNGQVKADPNAWLFKIKRCVCDNIEVNYAPAGYYQNLRPTKREENGELDLPPMGISIRLSFKELESLHRDLVENEGY